MMAGGLFMLGFGLIAMLLVIGLPVALIAVLIWALTRRGRLDRHRPGCAYHRSAHYSR